MQDVSTLPERLTRWTVADNGCWVWNSSCWGSGRPRTKYKGQWRSAYREVYAALVGPIPNGLTIDHLCHNKLCVNPAHLEPVTASANIKRWHRLIKETGGDFYERIRLSNAKLKPEDAINISKSTDTTVALAERYGVSRAAIYNIRHGLRWSRETGITPSR